MIQFIVIVLVLLAIVLVVSIKIIRPTERGLKERFGKYNSFLMPGINLLIPFVDKLVRVNITEQMIDAEPQEVITKENLNAKVDAQIYFKVRDDEESVKASEYNVNNYYTQITSLARTTLRDIIGKNVFRDVNSNRGKLNTDLAKELETQTKAWGIQVIRTELKEISPPGDVQDTMNKVLKAENEKTAAVDFALAVQTKASGEKMAAIQVADGEKQSRVLKAEGVAKAIQLENEAAQKFFRGQAVELKKLETVKEAFVNNTKYIIPANEPVTDFITKLMVLQSLDKKERK